MDLMEGVLACLRSSNAVEAREERGDIAHFPTIATLMVTFYPALLRVFSLLSCSEKCMPGVFRTTECQGSETWDL